MSKVFWCKLYTIPNKRMFVASLKLLMLIYQCCFFLFFSQLLNTGHIAQQECCPLLTFGCFFVFSADLKGEALIAEQMMDFE